MYIKDKDNCSSCHSSKHKCRVINKDCSCKIIYFNDEYDNSCAGKIPSCCDVVKKNTES